MFCKRGVLKNFTEKHLCQSLFFDKVAGLRPTTLYKKGPWHRRFPVNFVKFLRTPFFSKSTSGDCFWLFLESSQNAQENTSARTCFLIKGVLVQMFSCKFCGIFKYTFFHKTPLVAASILCRNSFLFLLYYFL